MCIYAAMLSVMCWYAVLNQTTMRREQHRALPLGNIMSHQHHMTQHHVTLKLTGDTLIRSINCSTRLDTTSHDTPSHDTLAQTRCEHA